MPEYKSTSVLLYTKTILSHLIGHWTQHKKYTYIQYMRDFLYCSLMSHWHFPHIGYLQTLYFNSSFLSCQHQSDTSPQSSKYMGTPLKSKYTLISYNTFRAPWLVTVMSGLKGGKGSSYHLWSCSEPPSEHTIVTSNVMYPYMSIEIKRLWLYSLWTPISITWMWAMNLL